VARIIGFAGGAALNFEQEEADTVPDAFAFSDQTGVGILSTCMSAPITVAGITGPTAISVTGGEYSVNGGAFTSSPGTVVNGDQVRARHSASGGYETDTNTVVDIGGVTDTFTSTTEAEPAPGVGVIAVRWWRRRGRR
jgi:hypothetical protein